MKGTLLTIPILFFSLMVAGTLGISHITDLIYRGGEFQIGYMALSLFAVASSLILSLRILYQLDKRSSRIRKPIRWFEPVGGEEDG